MPRIPDAPDVPSGPLNRARDNLTGLVAVLVTGTWLAAMVTGQGWWLGFMLVGYVVVVPVVALLFGDDADREQWWEGAVDRSTGTDAATADPGTDGTGADDALETLRDRYARGELTDEQFERKLERLLETETIEDVEDLAGEHPTPDGAPGSDRTGRGLETESGRE